MSKRKEDRRKLPYRLLLVAVVGGILALVLAAFSNPAPITPRTHLLLFAGLLLVVAVAVEIIFRDIARLREHVRSLDGEGGRRDKSRRRN